MVSTRFTKPAKRHRSAVPRRMPPRISVSQWTPERKRQSVVRTNNAQRATWAQRQIGLFCRYWRGGIVATLGLVTPSVIIILIVAKILSKFRNNPIVDTIFKYLRPAVIGLIMFALWQLVPLTFLGADRNILILPVIAFAVLLFCLMKFKKVHPIVWIGVGAVFGVIAL